MADIAYAVFIGLIAGVIPVYLGLTPLPLFRRLSPAQRSLLVGFSAGVLAFLFADVTGEAVSLAGSSSIGPLLLAAGIVLGLAGPAMIFHPRRADAAPGAQAPRTKDARMLTAYTIATGIGLHNFGEGLALGAAYGAGELVLTTALVIGFALHNGTEGLGISGPVSDIPLRLRDPIFLGFIAGFPTVIGSAIGAVAYSTLLGSLFFALAGGALLFVVIEIVRLSSAPRSMFAGLAAGILVMYFTDLLLAL